MARRTRGRHQRIIPIHVLRPLMGSFAKIVEEVAEPCERRNASWCTAGVEAVYWLGRRHPHAAVGGLFGSGFKDGFWHSARCSEVTTVKSTSSRAARSLDAGQRN